MSRTEHMGWAIATALAFTVPVAALLAARATRPGAKLRVPVEHVIRVLSDPELEKPARLEERRASIRQAAAEIFDFSEMTKRACGQHWSARTVAEREELTGLFRELIERAYISKIEHYSGEQVTFTGESVDDDDLATVRSRITTSQGIEIPVDYRMQRHGDRWAVYDVVIEGVSLVASYRGQFHRILQGGSHAELVRRLRAMLHQDSDAGRESSGHTARAR